MFKINNILMNLSSQQTDTYLRSTKDTLEPGMRNAQS